MRKLLPDISRACPEEPQGLPEQLGPGALPEQWEPRAPQGALMAPKSGEVVEALEREQVGVGRTEEPAVAPSTWHLSFSQFLPASESAPK